jgi:hypothetical protein
MRATVQATTGPATSIAPPQISNAAESNRVWREGHVLATFSRKHKVEIGTTFSFALNESGRVTLAFARHLTGRRVNGRCVGQTKGNRSKPRCQRSLPAGTLGSTGHSGLNRVRFQGQLSHPRTLPLGSYTVTIGATTPPGRRRTGPRSPSRLWADQDDREDRSGPGLT